MYKYRVSFNKVLRSVIRVRTEYAVHYAVKFHKKGAVIFINRILVSTTVERYPIIQYFGYEHM